MEIRNKNNELLDTSFEGIDIKTAKEIIVFNHGFGTDKHERGIFDAIVEKLETETNNRAFIRFSYSGYGQSEGKQEEKSLDTMADDLLTIWHFVDEHKSKDAVVKTLSFSMGNQILSKALSKNLFDIKTMICVNPANFKTREESKAKWDSRPGVKIDADNILHIPRADGSVTKIGQEFWDSIDPVSYRGNLTEAVEKYNSVLIRAIDDDVVDNAELTKLPFNKIIEIHGNHNYTKPEDRKAFLNTVSEVINEKSIK